MGARRTLSVNKPDAEQNHRTKMSNLWNKLLYHDAQDWWELPRTQWQEPNPQMEGPFGDGIGPIKKMWEIMTAANLHHGTPGFYVLIGVILSIITIVEVWAFAWLFLGALLVPLMLVLSLGKFVLVVGFFMHLKFDRKYYAWIFTACMIIGVGIFVALLVLLNYGGQVQQ